MTDPGEPALPVAAVARRLGVAPTTLRTWDRRYGLGPTTRVSGSHRRYNSRDLDRLEAMRRLVMAGVTPAEAARAALRHDNPRSLGTGTPAEPIRHGGTGGRVLPLPSGTPDARGLARAAMSLDADTVSGLLGAAVTRSGVGPTWERLLRPLLLAIGERWQHTGDGVEVEHLLCHCATGVLQALPAVRPPGTLRPVLLACIPDEAHELPLVALAAALREQRVSTRLLGADTPRQALFSAVRRTGPAALVLWSQTGQGADPVLFSGVPRLRPPTVLVAAGPGWPDSLPGDVRYASSLRQAVDLGLSAARG